MHVCTRFNLYFLAFTQLLVLWNIQVQAQGRSFEGELLVYFNKTRGFSCYNIMQDDPYQLMCNKIIEHGGDCITFITPLVTDINL